MLYLTYRVTKLSVHTIKENWKGNHDEDETLYKDDTYYVDLYRDSRDKYSVNFRYSDHNDIDAHMSTFNDDFLKADADYAKGLISYFRSASQI